MKRIYVILFAAALSTAVFSCEDKASSDSSENTKERVEEAGTDIKHAADSAGEAIKEESKKTTKNGDDAH